MRLLIAFVAMSVWTASAQVSPVVSQVYRWNDLKIEKTETRERRQILDGSTSDMERLEIHTSTVAPGKSPHSSHTHADEEELIIVKEGSLRITIKDKNKIVGPGSVALAIPGEEHGFENGGDVPVTYYIIKYKSRLPMNIERAWNAGGSFMIDWQDVIVNENAKGSRRNFFERPTSMTDRYEMHVTTLNVGLNSHPPHTHKAAEIILLIKGSAKMQIGDSFYDASAGDLIFLESGVLHALTNTGNGSCEYFAFQW
jgi:(S)-ureidoglycine aminohydrolase